MEIFIIISLIIISSLIFYIILYKNYKKKLKNYQINLLLETEEVEHEAKIQLVRKEHELRLKELQQEFERKYDELRKEEQRLEIRAAEITLESQRLDEQFGEKQVYYNSNIAMLEEQKERLQTSLNQTVQQIESRQKELRESSEKEIAMQQEQVKLRVRAFEETELLKTKNELTEKSRQFQEEENKKKEQFLQQIIVEKKQIEEELKLIKNELTEYQKKQQAINEAILRQRELEENLSFFSVNLDEKAIEDIKILLSIRDNLRFRENLDKLIYETYISKPVNEMIKRVLKGQSPSGIYKITRIKTGEIYIGKSTDIKKRWQEHCKTAFGVGTIAHSVLHTTIKKDGIENFTFELLEEVPKDRLTEREKYWISFYNSKDYGLNERLG